MIPGSAEWLAARCGKLTASRCAPIIKQLRYGAPSAERERLMMGLLAERLTGQPLSIPVSAAMQWGLDHEPMALAEYEMRSGDLLGPSQYVEHPRIAGLAATPDAFVGTDAVVEVKCPTTIVHLTYLERREVPAKYRAQILAQLACTGRTRAVFLSFDPRLLDPRLRLLVVHWAPEPAEIAAIESAAESFLAELASRESAITRGMP